MSATSRNAVVEVHVAEAPKPWFRRLAQYQLEAMTLDVQQSVSAVTRRGLTVLLMLAVSWLMGYLPGADVVLFKGLTIVLLLKLGVAVAVVWLMFVSYRQMVCVLAHFAREAFRLPPEETAFDASVLKLAWSVTLLVCVCLIYSIGMRALAPILSALTAAAWPLMLINIGSLAVAIAAIVGIFVATSPLFGRVGDSVARRVTPQPASDPPAKCPGCGVLYPPGSRYCAFCGKALPQTPQG